jgi:hypothetical protein
MELPARMKKLPQCRNPHHPSPDRDTMVCAEERADCFIFYCKVCAEHKIESVQVKTKAWLRDASRRELARKNQLLRAPPPRMKQVNMDSTLREEMVEKFKFEAGKKSFQGAL